MFYPLRFNFAKQKPDSMIVITRVKVDELVSFNGWKLSHANAFAPAISTFIPGQRKLKGNENSLNLG